MNRILHISLIASVLCVCLMSVTTIGQPGSAPDTWHGLTLNVSTPEDAIRILGKPSSDKANQSLQIFLLDKWLAGKHNQKVFRTLTFKKPEADFAEAQLSFFDNKLMMISLEAKHDDETWVDPNNLNQWFGIKFTPRIRKVGQKLLSPQEFESNAGGAPPKSRHGDYDMIGVSERSFILARVDNMEDVPVGIFTRGDVAGARHRNKERKERDAAREFPGRIFIIQIISRKLETP